VAARCSAALQQHGKRAAYCQPVAFIIAAIVAPTAIKPPWQEFDGGRRRFSMRHPGEMSSTHYRLIF
jgi:hypothetical protein